jgi:hypothetical protein
MVSFPVGVYEVLLPYKRKLSREAEGTSSLVHLFYLYCLCLFVCRRRTELLKKLLA